VRRGAAVARVVPAEDGGRRWRVVAEAGGSVDADAVVLAVPADRAADIVRATDAGLAGELGAIRSAGLAVVALGFEAATLERRPEGFGFLVPRCAGIRSLGCLWDSSIFPGRAPRDRVLLRVMIGGAHDPEAVRLDDADLLSIVRSDLARTMALEAEPCFVRVVRHPRGIAQYEPGHGARLARIEQRLERLPGLRVAGSSYYGVSMNSCVETAERQAAEVLDELAASA
jgi:oxygen-dependent protoporphyrinogen oxidase